MQKPEFCAMFTGIIESEAIVKEVQASGTNKTFWLSSPLELKVDQSLAHDGVCLTVEEIRDNAYRVTAIAETLEKTNLHQWAPGSRINLERALQPSGRLDGHFVQGHVDATGTCTAIKDVGGSRELTFSFPKSFAPLLIEKGSICVNGVSLTAFDVKKKSFRVAIIPYTWDHTNFSTLTEGSTVNLEFDLIGKYILRSAMLQRDER